MARTLTARGVPAIAVHGGSADETRRDAPRKLREREVNVLCTCDLYNEGVDLPFVDTLLMLRPTASATLFLQQIGRGLRLDKGKTACLVLDFIGQHRAAPRRTRARTASTTRSFAARHGTRRPSATWLSPAARGRRA
jgi:superfamily II DNA or RNA helicase